MDEKPILEIVPHDPGGRPTKYSPKLCSDLIEHMSKGYAYTSFPGVAGVGLQTMYDWEKVHPEWVEAKEIAFAKCQMHWEGLALKNPFNESYGEGVSKSLNAAVWIFNMKNRFSWRDRQPGEEAAVLINNNNTQAPQTRTVEEIDARIEALQKKLEGK